MKYIRLRKVINFLAFIFKQTSQVENCEHMSPSGKLPVLHCGKHLISEANTIVEFVNAKVRIYKG